MLKKANADMMTYLLLVGILLLTLEVLFDHGGLIFFLFFSSICIYLGKKRLAKKRGKLLFWFGIISLLITIMNLWAVKFLIFALAIYLLFQYRQSKKSPSVISPGINESIGLQKEGVIYRKPLFSNNILDRKSVV